MVSLYGYNRFGPYESFPAFVRRWHRLLRPYRDRGEKEEWYTPCHLLPMFEFTHYRGEQLVQSVVKQEELKLLRTKEGAAEAIRLDSSVRDLPDLVRDALLDMPHANARKTTTKWYDHYDQATLDLTHAMYHRDFAVFGYSPALAQRPDLNSPLAAPSPSKNGRASLMTSAMRRDSFLGRDGRRRSQAPLFRSARSSLRREMLGRSASSRSLPRTWGGFDRHELLAAVAGLRTLSRVRESEGSLDSDDEDLLDEVFGRQKEE